MNDLSQKLLNGTRNQPGALLAVAELGRGRVVAVTDAGWITNDVLADSLKTKDKDEAMRTCGRSMLLPPMCAAMDRSWEVDERQSSFTAW